MASKSKFHSIIRRIGIGRRTATIAKLKEFVSLAEMNMPIDRDSFSPFPEEDELGVLLNRVVEVYDRYILEQTSLSEAQELAVLEKQEQIRNKKQLTQNINHELKTPVSILQGYLETILNNPKISEEKKQKFIVKCYEQSQRLSSLLQDISTITRMDEGGDMISKEELSISDIIDDSVLVKIIEAAKSGINIDNNVPDGLMIHGNDSLLKSIFDNLISNAILYSNGSKITINLTSESEDYYTFSFYDNGVGMDEEHLTRIFERFYRIDKGRSRLLGGTGLGLSIVKNAILIHRGEIKAQIHEGGGLEFVFTLSKY